MIGDIVDELRHAIMADRYPWDVTVYERAIDEIERLRENIQYLHDVIASLRGEIREMEDLSPDPPPQGTPIGSKLLTAQPPRKVNRD